MDSREDMRADSSLIAATAAKSWNELSVRLSPVLGEDGFRLLFGRSLNLASARFPWLAGLSAPTDDPVSGLERALLDQTPANAAEASTALVATFTGLLHALIGEALTTRLLAPLPPEDGPDTHPQEVSP